MPEETIFKVDEEMADISEESSDVDTCADTESCYDSDDDIENTDPAAVEKVLLDKYQFVKAVRRSMPEILGFRQLEEIDSFMSDFETITGLDYQKWLKKQFPNIAWRCIH